MSKKLDKLKSQYEEIEEAINTEKDEMILNKIKKLSKQYADFLNVGEDELEDMMLYLYEYITRLKENK